MSMKAKIVNAGGALASLLLLGSASSAFALEGSVSADYVRSFEPADPVIGMSLGLSESLNANWSLILSQSVTKNLIIDSATDEWVASDTRLALNLNRETRVKGLSYGLSASATLPVSKASQHREIYSTPQLSANLSYSTRPWWTMSLGGFVRDTISAYETAPVEDGAGGEIIEDYGYGLSQGVSFSGGGFSGGYSLAYFESRFHEQERRSTEQLDFRSELPTQGYSFSLFVGRALWTGAEIYASYIQGTLLSQAGYEDYIFYDSSESQYSVGFSQSF